MRILLDSCVWGKAANDLRAAEHDVVWAGDWDSDPGDEEILAQAYAEQRILVTLDKDFGELAVVGRQPHCGILRVVNFSARDQARVCQHVLQLHGEELMQGAVITAEPGRLRIRGEQTDTSGPAATSN